MLQTDVEPMGTKTAAEPLRTVDFQPARAIASTESQQMHAALPVQPMTAEPQKEPASLPFHHIAMAFLTFWGIGVVFFLARIVVSWRRSVGLVCHAVPVDAILETRLTSTSERLRIRRHIRFAFAVFQKNVQAQESDSKNHRNS